MTQENKEILLKDLCARLPYGVRIEYNEEIYDVLGIAHGRVLLCKPFSSKTEKDCPLVEEVKPYLFPMSSMTEEQCKELRKLINTGQNDNNEFMRSLCIIEFYNKNHFDYRGLIEKGLAIDATGLNVY